MTVEHRSKPIEYSTVNPVYTEGKSMAKWFIAFVVVITILEVLS